MLDKLEITNGKLSPEYNKYNDTYTVKIEEDVISLDISYETNDNIKVKIFGNDNLKEGENKIVISINKEDNYEYIYLTAIKESSGAVFSGMYDVTTLEVGNTAPVYVAPLIGASCFLIILTLYAMLFTSKKRK
ncbi:MAG: cadherin-like beta sandwich domain-containing protein [Bacilli bacterium]|nr:cadherin-like beta sandwich domain-containing protein [Bacilli bacterium]